MGKDIVNLKGLHVTIGELSAKIVALEKSIEQGRGRNIKELDSIREEMFLIKESVDDLKRTANMGAGAWKAILGFGVILSIVWTAIRIIDKG